MKPYDPLATRYTKASGFHGAKCWDCYVKNQNAYIRQWRAEKPGYTKALYRFHKEREKNV